MGQANEQERIHPRVLTCGQKGPGRSIVFAGVIVLWLGISACLSQQCLQRPLTHDAYIWQRQWNNSLLTALAESSSAVRFWRVLAAESGPDGKWTEAGVNCSALKQTAKPVIAVFRIDGRRSNTPFEEQLMTRITDLAEAWKKDGVPVTGIEIDYDCATNRLPRYRDFLGRLRVHLRRNIALSITALPSWMSSRDLPGLLAEVDETVLQLHSVMSPQKGLFDKTAALRWAQAWSKLSPAPFRLALPTYWSRVSWNGQGQVVAIESEVNRYGHDPISRELIVEPAEVSSFIFALQQSPIRRLAGIAWFRLPTANDERAWTTQTWYAVMKGKPLPSAPSVVHFKTDHATGAQDVYLSNAGSFDTKLPAEISISADHCEMADALPPYAVERNDAASFRFRLQSRYLLRAGEERPVGWVRCSGNHLEGHASF